MFVSLGEQSGPLLVVEWREPAAHDDLVGLAGHRQGPPDLAERHDIVGRRAGAAGPDGGQITVAMPLTDWYSAVRPYGENLGTPGHFPRTSLPP
ncbi:hypothetical protein GCM10017556_37750 [Micromonospora sagamiensis]|nr:hypothetical protein GCM10017556_37750 [Micromonospora sagamiensis]